NPQTLNDAVLERIGRRHTAAQTVESFCQARVAGFTNINMDLIAGLPGDSYEGFVSTLDRVVALDPENVTVHTLSVKRAADLKSTAMVRSAAADAPVERMVDYAAATLGAAGDDPYYL
ncbi:coproporphyrinogen dehydrogenase HemZ, partial [Bittarella massiliensis]|nr:coproporphyrinogen dehydrogenase HemZ [Bittarella massiliensis (ex Durand et al. 2017)]